MIATIAAIFVIGRSEGLFLLNWHATMPSKLVGGENLQATLGTNAEWNVEVLIDVIGEFSLRWLPLAALVALVARILPVLVEIVKSMEFLLSAKLLTYLIDMSFSFLLLLDVLFDLVRSTLQGWLVIFILVPRLNVFFHLPWIQQLLPTVLTLGRLVNVITERLFAQLLSTKPADEIFRIALEVNAVMSVSFLSIHENRVTIPTRWYTNEFSHLMLAECHSTCSKLSVGELFTEDFSANATRKFLLLDFR